MFSISLTSSKSEFSILEFSIFEYSIKLSIIFTSFKFASKKEALISLQLSNTTLLREVPVNVTLFNSQF